MAVAAVTSRRDASAAPGIVPRLVVVALLTSRLLGRYWVDWAIGLFGIFFIALRGRGSERLVLATMIVLALAAGGGQMDLGIRAALFAAMFMTLARYCPINPWFHLAAQLVSLVIAFVFGGDVPLELFVYAPCALFLIISNEMIRDAVPHRRGPRTALLALFNVLSFVVPSLGSGSRSALFVWATVNVRRIRLVWLIVGALAMLAAIPILLSLRDLPVFQKLDNSLNEVTQPVDPDTGGFSQRAIENLTFLEYITAASPREILFGSTVPILLDGEPLGQDHDVRFVPHNQIFGMVFQIGLVGSAVFLGYLIGLVRWFAAVDRFAAFTMGMLLLPAFALKQGIYDADLALLAGTLNWVRRRQLSRRVAGLA